MKNSLVSIIMATHNTVRYLEEAIASVRAQTYSNFELIIINDASTDDTGDLLKDVSAVDTRIVVLHNKHQRGLSESLNRGIKHARGEYIARIDSDDRWIDPQKLEKQVAFLVDHKDVGIVGCWGYTIDTNGQLISKLQYPVTDAEIRNYLLIENCFIHSSVVIRSSLLKGIHGYDEQYKFAQDYDLWLSIGNKAQMYNLPFFMVDYRKNPYGISQTQYKKQIQETITAVKAHATQYPFVSISLLLWYARLFIPFTLRESISHLFRTSIFFNSFQTR